MASVKQTNTPFSEPTTELDIVLSFDTTGSMDGILWMVRNELERLTNTLFIHTAKRGISVRLAVIAQGDYGGQIAIREDPSQVGGEYTVLCTPFSCSPDVPVHFIKTVQGSRHQASEPGEAYEQVLSMARTLSWRPSAKKVLVVVGDDVPHEATCRENTARTDWKQERDGLVAAGVGIFAIHCLTMWGDSATAFYRQLGESGAYLPMAQFNSFVEILLATFYRATSERSLLETHEQEVITAGRYSRHMELAFNELLQRPDTGKAALPDAGTGAGPGTRIPVAPGRFQRLAVPADQPIKTFVEATGARYKAGDGYYELTKSEDISLKKNVVLEHIASGEMFTGTEARSLLGLSATNTKVTTRSIPAGYRAFVQSTSQTRKLVKDSSFLWEVSP